MKLRSGKFTVTRADDAVNPVALEKDGLVLGRLQSCDVVLNHRTISRVHAGINLIENNYFLINLSTSNSLTLNGRLLASEQADALADGDMIQIGPFTITVKREKSGLSLFVQHQFTGDVTTTGRLPALNQVVPAQATPEVADVLKVFWEKRDRDRDDYGSLLRPTGKPQPGKAQINWRPTNDLVRPWRAGLFSWSLIIIAVLAVVGFYVYPNFYAPAELSNPHQRTEFQFTKAGLIAAEPNANACSTCHTWNVSLDTACTKCHQATAFHATNTQAHTDAGVGCTSCHTEHQGANFEPRVASLGTCTSCHNDNNKRLYNGKGVRTPHKETYGYPIANSEWNWNGLDQTAAMMPDVTKFQSSSDSEQTRRAKEFHAVHLYRVTPVEGMKTDSSGAMSCSSCHASFNPIDRQTPQTTCAKCHNGYVDRRTERVLIAADESNCVSCHVQHPLDQNRWQDYLTQPTQTQRAQRIESQIQLLSGERASRR